MALTQLTFVIVSELIFAGCSPALIFALVYQKSRIYNFTKRNEGVTNSIHLNESLRRCVK